MQTWHHVSEKSSSQINNINALHGPFRRLLFKSGMTAMLRSYIVLMSVDSRVACRK
jgi:hypothetical protein